MTEAVLPRRTLGNLDVFALTVGIVIGAGIFRTPALVAGFAPDATTMIAAWIAGGLLSIVGALCYAELAAAWPSVGGDYHFLGRAYGERLAFLYAWARLAVIQTGSLALLAFIVGDYLQVIAPLGSAGPAIWAGIAVIAVSAINWLGIRWGAAAQRWLTLVEVAGLVAIIVAGIMVAPAGEAPAPISGGGAIGLMMVFVLLAYGGWSEAVYVSAEMKDAPRRMGAILSAGLALVTLLYVLVNLAALNSLGMAGMAGSDAVAAEVMRRALGEGGAAAISAAVAVSALTSANATAITGGRTAAALGQRFAALRWLGRWDMARDTPGNALVAQGAIALLLVVAGGFARDGFQVAVEYTAPVFWFFLLLVGVALFVLRRRHPEVERPFRVPLYPVLPAVFCATTAYLLWSSLAYTGWGALAGVAVLGAGAVLLLFLKPEEEMSQ
ncbi:amino acid permease [Sphingomonas sp.]|uniref:APC family permease n=1 Tax=Sphingomonas sp. TaxID=28214 RepID=UPI0031E41BD7